LVLDGGHSTYLYRSASEVQPLLYVVLDIYYIDENQHNALMFQLKNIKKNNWWYDPLSQKLSKSQL